MEYGERLFVKPWHTRFCGNIHFRFRVDPVPTIRKRHYRFRHWYNSLSVRRAIWDRIETHSVSDPKSRNLDDRVRH